MAVLLKNNAISRLAASLTTGATSLSVTAGDGAKYPSPAGGDWFPLTIVKADGTLEIMRCTTRAGDVMTVTRAQEGTAALAFASGDRVELRITASVLAEFLQDSEVSPFVTTLLNDADAAEFRGSLGLGNAALATIQTSASDAAAGRQMAVGAFGLGGATLAFSDANAIPTVTGFFGATGSLSNSPYAAGVGDMVIQTVFNPNSKQQIWVCYASSRQYIRRWNTSAWTNWQVMVSTEGTMAAPSTHPFLLGKDGGGPYLRYLDGTSFDYLQVRLGFTPVQQGLGPGQGANTISLGWDGGGLRASVGGIDLARLVTETTLPTFMGGQPLGGVGTYAFLARAGGVTSNTGDVVAGASLLYTSINANSGIAPTGAWRCMGYSNSGVATVWLRIS